MTCYEAIQARRSIRSFQGTPLPDSALNRMLQAARLSPSGGNGQAYRFGIVTETSLKLALAEAAGGQRWIAQAPVIIACCADLGEGRRDLPADDFGLAVDRLRFGEALLAHLNAFEDRRAVQTLFANATPLIPATHMMLIAASFGLGTCMIGHLDIPRANALLNLPDSMACLFLMPVGYPAETPGERALKPMEALVFTNEYQPEA